MDFGRSSGKIGRKMADGQLLFLALYMNRDFSRGAKGAFCPPENGFTPSELSSKSMIKSL